jgi:hypothetical protein
LLVGAGGNCTPDPGEGADPTLNGSSNDDDLHDRRVSRPWTDPDPVTAATGRPLMFYQVTVGGNGLRMTKAGATVRLDCSGSGYERRVLGFSPATIQPRLTTGLPRIAFVRCHDVAAPGDESGHPTRASAARRCCG